MEGHWLLLFFSYDTIYGHGYHILSLPDFSICFLFNALSLQYMPSSWSRGVCMACYNRTVDLGKRQCGRPSGCYHVHRDYHSMTRQLLRPNHSFAGQSTNEMTRPDFQTPSHAAMRSRAWKCPCLTWSVCKSSNDSNHAPALPTRPQRSTFAFPREG